MRAVRSLSLVLALCSGMVQGQDRINAARLERGDLEPFINQLKQHGLGPVDYLVEKFKRHDVVLLGETHLIRENCRFIGRAVDPLYHRAGVRRLASEFMRSRNTDRANQLVTASEFDDALVVKLFKDLPWPTFGFREYMDILRAVWKLNQSLPHEAEKMEIIGLDSNWNQYDLWFNIEDPAKKFQVRVDREKHMTRSLVEGAFEKKKKTLVHIGIAHTVTCQGLRLGTVLREKYGSRLFQVVLHHAFPSRRKPAKTTWVLEEAFAAAGGKPVGFDLADSPLGNLYDVGVAWWRMKKNARLSDFILGYVIFKPHEELNRVTWVDGFLDAKNFEESRAIAEKLKWIKKGECRSVDALEKKIKERFNGSGE